MAPYQRRRSSSIRRSLAQVDTNTQSHSPTVTQSHSHTHQRHERTSMAISSNFAFFETSETYARQPRWMIVPNVDSGQCWAPSLWASAQPRIMLFTFLMNYVLTEKTHIRHSTQAAWICQELENAVTRLAISWNPVGNFFNSLPNGFTGILKLCAFLPQLDEKKNNSTTTKENKCKTNSLWTDLVISPWRPSIVCICRVCACVRRAIGEDRKNAFERAFIIYKSSVLLFHNCYDRRLPSACCHQSNVPLLCVSVVIRRKEKPIAH